MVTWVATDEALRLSTDESLSRKDVINGIMQAIEKMSTPAKFPSFNVPIHASNKDTLEDSAIDGAEENIMSIPIIPARSFTPRSPSTSLPRFAKPTENSLCRRRTKFAP
ncbi:hypothetical protein NX059_010718 [Plenodomus lindquistii]|nr:hypothetical protein NX059_010718 [Plenodomus lindquistii]